MYKKVVIDMPAKRAIISISDSVLDSFNRAVPLKDRSRIVEGYMRKHVRSAESKLEEAAKAIEADPDYVDVMGDVAALTAETATRLIHEQG